MVPPWYFDKNITEFAPDDFEFNEKFNEKLLNIELSWKQLK